MVLFANTQKAQVTAGCLLRECLGDPAQALSQYSVVVLDEAHIRSMETDILFGLAKQFITAAASAAGEGGEGTKKKKKKRKKKAKIEQGEDVFTTAAGVAPATGVGVARPEQEQLLVPTTAKRNVPKLVIMSATLESSRLAEWFGCEVFNVPGQ
jgi:hypothetical protein